MSRSWGEAEHRSQNARRVVEGIGDFDSFEDQRFDVWQAGGGDVRAAKAPSIGEVYHTWCLRRGQTQRRRLQLREE